MKKMSHVVRGLSSATGLNYTDIGTKIGSTPQNIYKWATGKSKPDGEHLLALIKLAYQCNKIEAEKIIEGC